MRRLIGGTLGLICILAAGNADAGNCVDIDNDGFDDGACGGTDCNDNDMNVFPGASVGPADVGDGLDRNCDGFEECFEDNDGDGFGTSTIINESPDPDMLCEASDGEAALGGDCDDVNPSISPGAQEVCDALDTDEDCDGFVDDADANVAGQTTWYHDSDSDGFGDPLDSQLACDKPDGYINENTDCDDTTSDISPEAQEVCDAGDVDEDCNNVADDADGNATGQTTWYQDSDNDLFGNSLQSLDRCDQPNGYVFDDTDCDDGVNAINPDEQEICDAADVDENCNNLADDDDNGAVGQTTWYQDVDNDGFGNPQQTLQLCNKPNGYSDEFAECGDDIINTDGVNIEECDDGAANSDDTADACRTTCVLPACGDDTRDTGETCDDGAQNNDTAPGACRTNCALASCGDGVLDDGEECDDENQNSDTVADACRTTCAEAYCGDNVTDSEEECDNATANSDAEADACRTSCESAGCGDGVLDSDDACDDGDLNDGDGCSAICEIEEGTPCVDDSECSTGFCHPAVDACTAVDTDGDGIPDEIEIQTGTDPKNPHSGTDSDGDGVPNYLEELAGTDPRDATSFPVDSDNDGVPDALEVRQGTDPNDPDSFLDTDGDGEPDYQGVLKHSGCNAGGNGSTLCLLLGMMVFWRRRRTQELPAQQA